MIQIFRPSYNGQTYGCALNVFNNSEWVEASEVVVKTHSYFGKEYVYAEPAAEGRYAYGGCLIYDGGNSNIAFNVPMKLHDRNMDLENSYMKEDRP